MSNQDVTTEQRMFKLIQRLHTKTTAQELQWERTASLEVYQSSFPSYVVRLSVKGGGTDSPDYFLTIRSEDGTLIEQISDVNIQSALPESKAFTWMAQLYSMARRQALGVDKALDSLLNELG